MVNVLYADIINNFVKDNKIYYLEIFYLRNGIEVFASSQENISILGDDLVGYGNHPTLKEEAIINAIKDLIQQHQ